ncbi:MAG TPA: 6-phosphofructokinase, partial [Polyangiaceae bacterium]|nr:6-phosphofructokinase [Polyangiaceae bacterium]
SDFRSERYRGFLDRPRRAEAAETIRAQGFTHLVCVGGNGTFEGTKALLAELSAPHPPTGFINVSIDNDLAGDRAIGFLSGVEAGSQIARGLAEDAYTHKRVYLLEMMGNRSGRHALHCAVGVRAHLVILPFFRFTDEVLAEIAESLARTEYALVIVAEGYEADRRKSLGGDPVSASEFLRRQLAEAGLKDSSAKRVIAEPFTRYIRGVRPAFLDVSAAFLKAVILFAAFEEGHTEIMPYVIAAGDAGVRSFADVTREDRVERSLLPLLDRLGLPKFQSLVRERFASGGGM